MEKLLTLAKKFSDMAEVYAEKSTSDTVIFQDLKLKDIVSHITSGYCLRLFKGGRIGFAYTRHLHNRQQLIDNALGSLNTGPTYDYNLLAQTGESRFDISDPEMEKTPNSVLVTECNRVGHLLNETEGQVDLANFKSISEISVLNSNGLHKIQKTTSFVMSTHLLFPGTKAGIHYSFYDRKFNAFPEERLNLIKRFYQNAKDSVDIKKGKMKVLFMPHVIHTLTWRIFSGLNAKNIFENKSPLVGKIGKKIFSDKITISDDPFFTNLRANRFFDDEGTERKKHMMVEKGILKNFFTDLKYATKLNIHPSGQGFKSGFMENNNLPLLPSPNVGDQVIAPGDKSFDDLINAIDQGVIIFGALGAHSGNIPNGDYSIGLSPGLYVKDGKIKGRIKDTMIAGNIYETLQNVVDVENQGHPYSVRVIPSILCENVMVSTKN